MAVEGLELKKNEYRKQKQDGRRSRAEQMCSPKCSVGVGGMYDVMEDMPTSYIVRP
jgi:hypothetical protein